MFNRINLISSAMLAVILAFFQVSEAQTLAFPGAEGFGRFAKGGRGGRIIEVTNLNEDGPGTLRTALEDSGARIVVFRVGGAIELTRQIQINYPYVTLAGQTAPGGGIQINGDMLNFRTGEAIIRHVRIRNGNPDPASNTAAIYVWNPDPDFHGGDNTLWSENVMIDHVSAGWSSDDNYGIWGRVRNVTVQWSISSESGGTMLIHPAQQGLSVHHNLMATNSRRYPCGGGNVDVVNNVMYNYPQLPTWINGWMYAYSRPAYGNILNNYYKEGPWTKSHADYWGENPGEIHMAYICDDAAYPNSCNSSDSTELYVSGNLLRRNQSAVDEPARIKSEYKYGSAGSITQISNRHSFPQVTTTSAAQAYTDVLAKCGAFPRDAIDTRVVDQTTKQTSIYPYTWSYYDPPGSNWQWTNWDPKTTVGWPNPAGGTPPVDTDHDGMPDSWETSNSLNPNLASDGPLDKDGDGYTNVEEYLNELADNLVGGSTAINPARPNLGSKSTAPKVNQCPLDIFGRTLGENVKNSKKRNLAREIMERKLGQNR